MTAATVMPERPVSARDPYFLEMTIVLVIVRP
jgi:hypothetical protein